jgi:short-subunit dehydrogenase
LFELRKYWFERDNKPAVTPSYICISKTTDHMQKKKVWFITGASHGLGLAFVKLLLERGDQVAATTRSLAGLSKHITALAQNFLPLQVDLTDEQAIAQAIAETHRTFGRIDVVVNNAGYAVHGAIEDLGPAVIDRCFAINTVAPMTVMYKVLPYLRRQHSGYILNISSLTACATATDIDLYAATKHAVLGLSELIMEEVRNTGIRVTVVAPASFQTQLWAKEYFTLENVRLTDHNEVAAGFIEMADQPAPPQLLLLDNHLSFLKIQKHSINEIQFVR